MEEEVDLRQYTAVLIRYRWLILAGTLIPALVALLVSAFLVAPVYEAAAGILIAQTRSQITFDPRFQTDMDEASRFALAQQARRGALVAMVKSGAIASQVAEDLEGELSPEERRPARLLEMVEGSLWQQGAESQPQAGSDYIAITVQSRDPAKAVRIANAWGQVYVEYVNGLYRDRPETYASVQKQAGIARETYEVAEQALVDFTAESQIGQITLAISDTQRLLDQQVGDRHQRLSSHYASKRQMERLLEDARSLNAQVQASGADGAATNSLAILMLKAQAFSTSSDLPGELQLQLELSSGVNAGASAQQADMEALVTVLEARLGELETLIEAELVAPLPQAFDSLQEEMQGLRARLETEWASQRELSRARDVAWETYSTLQVKADELSIATQMGDVEVRFASPAVESIRPVGPNETRNALAAAALGFVLSVGVPFVAHYLSSTSTRPVSNPESEARRAAGEEALPPPVSARGRRCQECDPGKFFGTLFRFWDYFPRLHPDFY